MEFWKLSRDGYSAHVDRSIEGLVSEEPVKLTVVTMYHSPKHHGRSPQNRRALGRGLSGGDLDDRADEAFRVDFITPNHSALPLRSLYFCDASNLVVAPSELTEEIDSYYCTFLY